MLSPLRFPEVRYSTLIYIASAWIALALNTLLYEKVAEWLNTNVWLANATLMVVAFLLNVILFSVFAYRGILKPVISLTFIVSASCAYFMQTYGVVIDHDMLTNGMETNTEEVMELIDVRLIVSVFIWGIVPTLLVWFIPITYPTKLRTFSGNLIRFGTSLVVAIALLATQYSTFSSMFRNHREIKSITVPLNWIAASNVVIRQAVGSEQRASYTDLTGDVMAPESDQPQIIVLVLGETARADHFSLNGYAKNTTPHLKSRLDKGQLVNFEQVSSCGTATAVSLPCMVSYLNQSDYDSGKAKTTSNLVDVYAAAGYQVSWIDNNSGCKDMCNRIDSIKIVKKEVGCESSGEYCYDTVLNEQLAEKLKNVHQNTLIVMHMIGGHGPEYSLRSPEDVKQFQPECHTPNLDECSVEEITNAYDNTIVMTDIVVDRVIQQLTETGINSTLVYVSDHGESLGENGVYLHGLPYFMAPEAQTHVPMVIWQSQWSAEQKACLQKLTEQPLSHDNLFHTLVGKGQIQTSLYTPDLDMYHLCSGI